MPNQTMNEQGWWKMDLLERSQSLNREALLKWVARAFQNRGWRGCER